MPVQDAVSKQAPISCAKIWAHLPSERNRVMDIKRTFSTPVALLDVALSGNPIGLVGG